MNVSVCVPADLGEPELARWRKIQREDEAFASPFLSPEFAVAVGHHRKDVRVAVVEDAGQIVGFLPFHWHRRGIGQALGYGLSNAQGFVHSAGYEWQAGELLTKCGLAVWEFDNLVGQQALRFDGRHAKLGPAPYIDLSHGWNDWIDTKRKASRAVKTVLKHQRRLVRDKGDVSFEFNSTSLVRDLDLLKRWKSHQYRRTGRPDTLAKPWVVAIVDELSQVTTPDFGLVLSVLSQNGQPIAMRLQLSANGLLSGWFPAYDVNYSHYSPGAISTLELVRAACDLGYREIDMAKGYNDLKEMVKNGDRRVAHGWAERPTFAATARRLQQAPGRHISNFVLASPRLRRAVRTTRNQLGRIHVRLRG